MRLFNSLLIGSIICLFSCNSNQEHTSVNSFAPKIVEARGYVVPKDSMAEPKVVPAGIPKVVPIGEPKVTFINTNVHPAGIPRVVIAGIPKVCTPGQDSFSLPKTVPAIERSVMAGIPETVIAKEAFIKDQNTHNFSSFGKLQGLKNDVLKCLRKDKRGNLWIGMQGGGVCRYDGKSFTYFSMKEGFIINTILSMLEDKMGNLWFGTLSGGLSKYDGKCFTNFTQKEGLSDNYIHSIEEDKSGNLWFGTGLGVNKYNPSADSAGGKSFTHFTVKEGLSNNSVRSILEDKSGNLWFGTHEGGVNKYDGKSFTHFTVKEGLSNNSVISIHEDKNGSLWFGTDGGGVNKYDPDEDGTRGKSFTHFTVKEGLSNNSVFSMREDKNGNLWFGTGGGVNKYDGKNFTHFTEKEGLSNNSVREILEDTSGNLWFATAGGLSKYGGKSFTHYTVKEGLGNSDIRSLLEDKEGNLWFGSASGGVSKFDGKSFTHFTNEEGRLNAQCMLEDKDGNLWFGNYVGVSKFDGKSFTHFTEKEGLSKRDVKSIFEDKSGNLWFGTFEGGVNKFDGKSFTHFTKREGLSHNIVWNMLEDRHGNLWFGTGGGGLTKYDPSALPTGLAGFTHFTGKEGFINNFVNGILEDKSGNLWFGTGGGVCKYDGKRFTYFTEKEGLSYNSITSSLMDKSGNLWFGSGFGLNKLEKDMISSFTTPKIIGASDEATFRLSGSKFPFKTYTYEDGFSGIGVNGGKTIYEASDGIIWIAANHRITAFDPREENEDTIAPNIQLTGVNLFNENIAWQNLASHPMEGGQSPDNFQEGAKDTSIVLGNGVKLHDFHFDGFSKWYGVPEHLSLVYNNNYLSFQFVGITLQSPKKVKYQYKLEGLDENWSAITSRSEATYGNLPHGNYTFYVKAMNGEGYWSEALSYPFKIRPPWWFTWWAYSIYGILFGLFVWLIHRYQTQRVLRIEREKTQAKELEQAKEIEKAYNQLGQAHENLKATQTQLIHAGKMASLGELTAGIAHEIQNPLNFVNNFSEINKELIADLNVERSKLAGERNNELETQIIKEIEQNEEKIIQHGKRADIIVKGMLQHSRSTSDKKELTNINALCGDYIRLAYHGLKAKDPSFQANYETHFDPDIPKVNVIPQELGRAILNIINNAFQAVAERSSQITSSAAERSSQITSSAAERSSQITSSAAERSSEIISSAAERSRQGVSSNTPPVFEEYQPTVVLTTLKEKNKVIIKISDNGPGIPYAIKDKIFQPFFTTKPTGQGTGLGLSLAYDIITKGHGGDIKVISNQGPPGGDIKVISNQGPLGGDIKVSSIPAIETEFIISLPV